MLANKEKMYRQILVRPENRKFQRILWRSNYNAPVSMYKSNIIIYGYVCIIPSYEYYEK